MKRKLGIFLLSLFMCVSPTFATPSIKQLSRPRPISSNTAIYQNGYNMGYREGKNTAYDNTIKTVAIIGGVLVIGVILYEWANPHWTTNEKGIVYRF